MMEMHHYSGEAIKNEKIQIFVNNKIEGGFRNKFRAFIKILFWLVPFVYLEITDLSDQQVANVVACSVNGTPFLFDTCLNYSVPECLGDTLKFDMTSVQDNRLPSYLLYALLASITVLMELLMLELLTMRNVILSFLCYHLYVAVQKKGYVIKVVILFASLLAYLGLKFWFLQEAVQFSALYTCKGISIQLQFAQDYGSSISKQASSENMARIWSLFETLLVMVVSLTAPTMEIINRFRNFYSDIDLKMMIKDGYPFIFEELSNMKRVRMIDLEQHLRGFLKVEHPEKSEKEIKKLAALSEFRKLDVATSDKFMKDLFQANTIVQPQTPSII